MSSQELGSHNHHGRERSRAAIERGSTLSTSEQQFRSLADAAPVMIWMSGPDKEGIFFNQPWLTFTGKTTDDQQGDGWLKLVHPDDQQKLSEICERSFQERIPFTTEFRLRRADGQYRWLLDSGVPRFDPNGEFLGFNGSCVDITDRKQAEELQAELAAIVESSDDAIVSKTLTGIIRSWNAGAERLFGYSAAEMLGESVLRLIPPELRAEEDSILQRLRRGERVASYETVRQTKDGRRIDVSLTISPIRNAQGQIVGASKVARDITERKKSERSLRESDQRLQLALSAGHMGYWEWTLDTNRVMWSPGLEAIHGIPPGSFGGTLQDFESDMHPDDREKVRASITCAVETGAEHHVEYRIIRPDGSLRWVEGCGLLQPDESGDAPRMVGICRDITDRKVAEEALQHSTQRYRAIVESQTEMLCRFRPEGEILFVNEAYARARNTTPEELTGGDFWNYVDAQDREQVRGMLENLSPAEPEVRIENRFHTASGPRWTLWTNRALRFDAKGRALEVQSSGIDITDRKQAEAALKAKEAELQLVAETTPLMLARCSRELRYLFVNRALADLYDLTPEQIIGRPIPEIVSEETFATIRPHIEQVLRGNRVEYEAEIPHPKGHRWIRANYIPEWNDQNQVVSWIATIADITSRKQLEHSLRFLAEASKSLSALVDYATTLERVAQLAVPTFADWCVVDMFDADGTVQHVSIAHADAAKVQEVEKLRRRYPPDPNAPTGSMKVLRTGEPELITQIDEDLLVQSACDEDHLRLLRELGLRSYMCVPLKAQGRVLGVISFVAAESGRQYTAADLSMAEDLAHRAAIAIENVRLYEELRDADRRKDEFLAMLAHELRNPLAPIRSGLELMALEPGSNREAINLMQDQLQHLVRLVDDLLDVSRIMRGKIELRQEHVQLQTLVERSLETVRGWVEEKRHQLVVDMPREAIWLNADPVRLLQVIENLVTNSLKYTDPGGRIDVIVQRQGDEALVHVRDTGIGIEAELLPKVFELFTQSSRSLDRAQGGLGIGLTLVQRLVELHHGTVTAHSEGPGHGSTFTVRLPSVEVAKTSAPASTMEQVSQGRRILVVDDNQGAARMLSILLAKLGGHSVETAHDGPSALEKVLEMHPALVLLDIGLPGMDGYQVAREIRQRPEFADVILAALTGYGQEEDRRRSQEAGFDHHLVKPVEISELESLLAQLARTAD